MEAEIKFEPEGRTGVIATGSYLYDAAKRLGVYIEECERRGETDLCAVEIVSGKNLLSEPTKAELETLGSDRFIKGERLACQAKVVAAGEIVVMAKEKKQKDEEDEKAKERKKVEEFRKEFEEMPLEKKIAALLELEAVALSETVSFVLNSPYHIVGKIMDVMAEFGLKIDREEKDAKTPDEHKTAEEAAAGKNGKASAAAADDGDKDAADSDKGKKSGRSSKKAPAETAEKEAKDSQAAEDKDSQAAEQQ
ncbi:MAG TPA: 2Fe-2S iron-sulfur cluster-binding protein [Pyrinomonadaceae bacterium]|nr:2Fe-2S iron-sulfur cluster-binding protein [Pyrinomonadaceae bacterium]